ncbi:hypothetical protein [Neobacillus sp. OS1-33]|uniref:hypothetical protein n=1 Tax=Neobacillus sp. OS1-33 TaxID=3070683 RepID=UPI0027E18F60|nr:hypothetical protein [Neobacillus sp. OS1-33]WML26304.1 hypothetical protein RCG22_01260 [Neobacillus sp. OS1-33]
MLKSVGINSFTAKSPTSSLSSADVFMGEDLKYTVWWEAAYVSFSGERASGYRGIPEFAVITVNKITMK